MRPNRLIAAMLCLTVSLPQGAFAQSATQAAVQTATQTPTQKSPPSNDSLTTPTATIDANVFGLYGGAAARFANRPGEKAGLQASMNTLQLPDLGDGSGGALTPQAERRLGERLMRDLRRDPDYLDDWLIRDYLNSIAARLSAAAATQYIGGYLPDFELFPVRDPQINAFSMPGGFIGVNTGLIATSQTESELASVVGHEMGHVLQRHIARMMGSSERSGYAALAAMLFGVLAGVVARSGDLGMGIAMGGQAFALDNQLRFSRSAEHEADRVGFQMLSAAGYDPYAMVSFFARLDRTAMGDNGVPPYLRTHPLTGERMADMEDRARRVPYRQPRQDPEYGFVRARARVLQMNSTSEYRDVASRLRAEIEDQTALNVAANWYGIALAETLQRNYDAANKSLAEARNVFDAESPQDDRPVSSEPKAPVTANKPVAPSLSIDVASPASAALASLNAAQSPKAVVNLGTIAAKRPQDRSSPSLDVLAADIARLAGHDNVAIHLADTAQARWPASHAAIETHLQALLSARRFTEAQALARRETRDDPNQPDWWRYLAQASAGANDAMAQHRAMAEKLALDGAWPSAIRQLQAARDLKNAGFYDLSTISARLRDFETRYKEEREMEKDDS
ncbi:peptidase M48 [Burkholderia sp. Leaf177]|uniref:M48 family metalloprotease n=1 Tax=Burkholderia sp. Leaf177 TaxID=1736287 RepID=UPI0006F1EF91|nr:M48 family metalloprotease [Burkholderia sp. Leaf177]KQR90330.1 peptidase M48 [Burkholderia sp. Leaf177]